MCGRPSWVKSAMGKRHYKSGCWALSKARALHALPQNTDKVVIWMTSTGFHFVPVIVRDPQMCPDGAQRLRGFNCRGELASPIGMELRQLAVILPPIPRPPLSSTGQMVSPVFSRTQWDIV